jgi:flagellar motor component MotA
MSWVPAPMFWSLLLLIVYWCVLFGMLGDSAMALVGMWIGVFAYLFFLPFAYKAERYRKRF